MQTSEIQLKQDQNISTNNYEKAKKMSIDEIQKKGNRSQSIQNILSSSIARAKQKIQMMQQKKHPKQYRDPISTNKSVQKKQSKELASVVKMQLQPNNEQVQTTRSKQPTNKMQSNIAVVTVVKSLQTKIAQLQKLNESVQRQKQIMTKQLNNVSEQKKLLLESLQQAKKKNLHLEQTTIKSTRQQIKQLQQNIDALESENLQIKNQVKQLELKLKQQHQNHLSIQKNNEKKLKEKKQEDRNQQKAQMIYMSKLKETQTYERSLNIKQKQINEKQAKLELKWREVFQKEQQINRKQRSIGQKQAKSYDQLVRHNQTMNLANQVRRQLQQKNIQLRKQIQQDRKTVKQLQQALQGQKALRQQVQLNMDHTHREKIQQLEDELQQLKQMHRHNSKSKLTTINKNDKIDSLKDELAQVIQQYEQLLARYKKTQQKLQKQHKQSKNYRSKFWKLKQIISQISQKVSKMPNAIHSQLRLLIVRANKLQSYQIQKSSLSNVYGTPNKKPRSNSIQNKSASKLNKQRSKSKQKTINLTYMDSSRKSNTSAKSKRSQKSERSHSKKKQVIISTTNKALLNETDLKVSLLEKEIQQLKSTYKKLVQIMNQRNDEETRNQLNNLVFQLQQKSQELTKVKKQKKLKKL